MTYTEFLKRFLTILVVFSLVTAVWAARSMLILGFAAAIIAVGISIPSTWLQQKGLKRGWAIFVAAIGVGLVIVALLLLVLPRLLTEFVSLLSSIPDALRSAAESYATLRARIPLLQEILPPITPTNTSNIDPDRLNALLSDLVDASLAIAPNLLGGASILVTTLVNLLFVLLIAVFFLVDPQIYVKASLYLLPKQYHARAVHLWNEVYEAICTWISSLFLSIGITVTLVWLILGVLLGMPNAIVVAVFAGLATFIPNFGAFIPIIPITIFTLADDPSQLVIMVPAYLAIQLLESNVITPYIMNAELEIPAGALMVFQLVITLAFGALGLLLAVPIMAILIVIVREVYSYDMLGLRHTAVSLSSNADGKLSLQKPPPPQDPDPIPPPAPAPAPAPVSTPIPQEPPAPKAEAEKPA